MFGWLPWGAFYMSLYALQEKVSVAAKGGQENN
jgi:hypothetical protein